jgi:hypothetical protein
MFKHSPLQSFIMSFGTIIIVVLVTGYGVLNAYLYLFQRDLLYHPAKNLAEPEIYGLKDTAAIRLRTNDNIQITAWYHPANEGEPTIVYLHGNTGNLGDRSERLAEFLKTGMGLMAVSYRGFGDSEGKPSKNGMYNDARSAISYLLKHKNIKISDIVLYGESLGSGVASKMAREYPSVRALVLEAPYTSIADRAAELYPYAPVRWILKDNFNNKKNLPKVHVPLLLFHGYLDETMPIQHSRTLLSIANAPKEARFFEQVGHTDFDFRAVSEVTHEFVNTHKTDK